MKTRLFIIPVLVTFSFVPLVLASGHNTCEPDMYGNLWCDPPVEDRLTLERFLFDPPIVNEKPTLPIGLVILIVSIIAIGVFVIWGKRKCQN